MLTRTLHLSSSSCQIHLEHLLLDRSASAIIRSLGSFPRVFIAADSSILPTHARTLTSALGRNGFTPFVHPIIADESRKSFDQSASLASFLLSHRCSRADLLIALGGGITCDLVAFTASIFHRGLPLLLAPTTLLAQVDAAIGAKTALNFPLPDHALGKNILGTFYPPLAILIDPSALSTLPSEIFAAGLAECVKHALLADPAHLSWLQHNASDILALRPHPLSQLISTSISIKSSIVESDPLEMNLRAHLNLGHTFAHAIESIPALNLSHGQAVSIGLCAAAELSRLVLAFNPVHLSAIRALLSAFRLPTALPAAVPLAQLLSSMLHDKKSSHDRLRFILLRDLALPAISSDISLDHLRSAWLSVGASP